MLNKLKYLVLLTTIYLLAAICCFAQVDSTSGEVVGIVRDQQGGVITDSQVNIKQLATNQIRTIQADEKGQFHFLKITPGAYEVTATAEGFNAQTEKVTINIGRIALMEFVLTVLGSSDVIEVTTSDNLSQTESSTNIDKDSIAQLPINRRNFLDFALTAPRFTSDFQLARSTTFSSGFSANGQSGRFNNVTVDGLDNNDRYLGAVRATFSQEAVQEFQVISDGSSAEFGRALGGIINIVTSGGNNQYHGTLFFINRDERAAARQSLSVVSPPSSQHQFGALLSGPIKRDKAFFFLSFERFLAQSRVQIDVLPQVLQSFKNRGFSVRTGILKIPDTSLSLLGRFDIQLSPSDTLWVRYNFGGVYQGRAETFSGIEFENVGGARRLTDNVIAFNNTHLNNSNGLVNETRFLFSSRDQQILAQDTLPDTVLNEDRTIGRAGVFFRLPQVLKEQVYQVIDNVSLTHEKHQIKFGIDFQYFHVPAKSVQVPFFNSGFARYVPLDLSALSGIPNLPSLTGLQAFDPSLRTSRQKQALQFFANILPMILEGFPAGLDLPNTPIPFFFVQNFGDPRTDTTGEFLSLFAQDDIKLRPNLLIKLGLRYDLNRIGNTPDNNGNVSPRIAFSYQPKALPALKIRGSYGLFFGVPLTSPGYDVELSKRSQPVVLPFPFTAIPASLPDGRFPLGDTPPNGVPINPQFGAAFQYDRRFKSSYTQQISLATDYSLDRVTKFSLAYTYVKGIKLFGLRNINPVVRPIPGDIIGSMRQGRVFPNRGTVIEFSSSYDSDYHAFTATLERRFSSRWGVLASYTFSKSLDNTNSIEPFSDQQANDPLRPDLEKSYSLQDQRHRLVVSSVLDLPSAKNLFLRDYQISTIFSANSGRPYNLVVGQDINMNGDIINPTDRPLGIARNVGILPTFVSIDLRISRKIKIKDSLHFIGFVEIFNALNRVNIFNTGSTTGSSKFSPDANGNFMLPPQSNGRYLLTKGQVADPFSSRQLQFGVRLQY